MGESGCSSAWIITRVNPRDLGAKLRHSCKRTLNSFTRNAKSAVVVSSLDGRDYVHEGDAREQSRLLQNLNANYINLYTSVDV